MHIWGKQAPVCSNYLPLQMTLLPAKLKQAGFQTHMIGKGVVFWSKKCPYLFFLRISMEKLRQ